VSLSIWRSRRPEFGDALLFPYIAVFARQLFWFVDSNLAAWILTLIVTAIIWLAYVLTKPAVEERTPRAFWLIVAVPLILIFALRAAIPDLAFDVLNHRIIQAERSLRGPQLLPGDFFPTIFPFNPLSDMLTGVFRHLFGYRLGTVINLLAIVWAGTVVEKILRPIVPKATWRCIWVLLALFTEHALFQINSYMVDPLALPLLLEATRLALDLDKSSTRTRDLFVSALLLGGACALKLTNAAMVIPILAIFSVRLLSVERGPKALVLVLVAGVLFVLPLLPHALYIYRETGNPVFPLYNNLIESPLWPDMTPYDGRWGPRDSRETLLWPFLTLFRQERLSELGVYSGRVTLSVVAALLCMLLPRVAARTRLIALAVVLGSALWTITSGYVRYALFIEIMGGVLVLYLAQYFARQLPMVPRLLRYAVAAVPLCCLAAQVALAATYVRETEWSKRPIIFDDAAAHRQEARWIWRDRRLMDFQTAELRELFQRVDAWVVSDVKTNGVEVLLRPDVPMLAVNNLEYFDMPESRRRFKAALDALNGKRIFSLSLTEDLPNALELLKRRRFDVGEIKTVLVPFFSARTKFHMTLIELKVPEKHIIPRRAENSPKATEARGPLEEDAFMAGISATGIPPIMQKGQRAEIRVTVKNLSESVWPSIGTKDYVYLLTVSNGWYDDVDSLVDNMDGKVGLPQDLWPGEEATVPLAITAPEVAGEYILEIDMVQEGIAWFKDRGSTPLRARIRVE
jgi:hypothetical protein